MSLPRTPLLLSGHQATSHLVLMNEVITTMIERVRPLGLMTVIVAHQARRDHPTAATAHARSSMMRPHRAPERDMLSEE